MTIDLYVLTGVCVLFLVLTILPTGPKLWLAGLGWGMSNRDKNPEFPAWVQRADRAQKNLLENLITFAPLVLIAHVAGRHNAQTALGAEIFLAARVVHALVYLAGIPGLRTVAWATGVGAEVLILLQLR